MIPFGHLCIRSKAGGADHATHFTHDEQVTLLSLWALAPSPLMFGGNLPDDDEWTDSLLTNDEVIGIDQDPAGKQGVRVWAEGEASAHDDGTEVWMKELANGDRAVGLFNRGNAAGDVTFDFSRAGLSGSHAVRDVWNHRDLGGFADQVGMTVAPHGAVLLKVAAK
jgi:hypothetical protein